MPRIKATYYFSDGKYGWQESLWSMNTVGGTVEGTMPSAVNLANLRAPLLGAGISITRLRVSDELQKGSMFEAFPWIPNGMAAYVLPTVGIGGFPDTGDNPYSGVLVRIDSAGIYHGMHYFGGVPDQLIRNQRLSTPAEYPDSVRWLTLFNAWLDQLTGATGASPWGFKVWDRNAKTANIVAVGNDGKNRVYVVTQPDLALPCNSKVIISGAQLWPGSMPLNGTWRTQGFPAGVTPVQSSFVLTNSSMPVLYRCAGLVTVVQYRVVPITGAVIMRPAERKRGCPWDSPRGKGRSGRATVRGLSRRG